ncbi:MAG: 16S rRNA (cytosine(1402)-N(4))-methyltransferase RsmH [Vampirovibrionales bacterium]|nr:16S rRNA (cytosine(1402)-N(4))-methyltransferase RsmH [Vampirovibrionales bacterium]
MITPSQDPKSFPASTGHIPVLCEEVLSALLASEVPYKCQPQLYVDCTLGGGGHSEALIERYGKRYGAKALEENFVLLGIDQDKGVLENAQARLRLRYPQLKLHFYHGNFSQIKAALKSVGFPDCAGAITGGLLADIGVSSFQFDQGERGFSFNKEAPLDMRMNQAQSLSAAEVVNTYSEKELVRVFSDFGEERFSKTIARLISERRKEKPFETTLELSLLIKTLYQQKLPPKAYKIHPATKVFQALRIEVNQELSVLETLLQSLPEVLGQGARACVISFHSLEDRIVKNAFRAFYQNDGPLMLLTRKPVTASEQEILQNPRSRSAKLRVSERR